LQVEKGRQQENDVGEKGSGLDSDDNVPMRPKKRQRSNNLEQEGSTSKYRTRRIKKMSMEAKKRVLRPRAK